jgi:hypothetical protein
MTEDGSPARRRPVGPPARDMTPLPDLLHDGPRSGPVRTRRPVYLDLLPPCNSGCPASENIQAWLADIQAGRPEQAWRQLVADNPLPAIHGRVCYHPCETVCNPATSDRCGPPTVASVPGACHVGPNVPVIWVA